MSDRVPNVSANGLDFPSGHSTQAAAAYTAIAVLLAQRVGTRAHRALVYSAAVLCAALVGVSRLYLGVHWFTDVSASWLLGVGWALTVQVSEVGSVIVTTVGVVAVAAGATVAGQHYLPGRPQALLLAGAAEPAV